MASKTLPSLLEEDGLLPEFLYEKYPMQVFYRYKNIIHTSTDKIFSNGRKRSEDFL